jgi:hypothetical protein
MVMTQKISASVFSSGSSVHVSSSVNTQGGTLPGTGAGTEYTQQSAATVSVKGVSLEATYHLEPGGLSVVVQGFDHADPNGTRLHERLLLKPGERRVIAVRRAHGQPTAHFTIIRIGDGAQISAGGT